GPRFQEHVPRRDLLAEVLRLVLLDETVADVFDLHGVPVELALRALQVRLHVVEQLVDEDFVGLEADLVAVAEAEVERGVLSSGLGWTWLEAAPVADDLIEPLLAPVVVAGAVIFDESLPNLSGLRILPPILERLSELAMRLRLEVIV